MQAWSPSETLGSRSQARQPSLSDEGRRWLGCKMRDGPPNEGGQVLRAQLATKLVQFTSRRARKTAIQHDTKSGWTLKMMNGANTLKHTWLKTGHLIITAPVHCVTAHESKRSDSRRTFARRGLDDCPCVLMPILRDWHVNLEFLFQRKKNQIGWDQLRRLCSKPLVRSVFVTIEDVSWLQENNAKRTCLIWTTFQNKHDSVAQRLNPYRWVHASFKHQSLNRIISFVLASFPGENATLTSCFATKPRNGANLLSRMSCSFSSAPLPGWEANRTNGTLCLLNFQLKFPQREEREKPVVCV